MTKPLRVLIVEDSEDDALLVIRELQHGGYDTTFERVETAEAMTAALEKQAWDIIIADYSLPHFSAPEALELFHQSGLDLPFIVISGVIGEETAVETMKAGAHDYLMKGNLTRLVPTIERELREAEVRKERRVAEEQLQIAEQNFRNSLDNSPLGIRIVTAEGELLYANQAILDVYGYSSVEELKATPAKKRYTPKSYAEHQERKERRKLGKPVPSSYEISIVRKDGEIRHLGASRKAVVWGGEVQFQTIYQDITERKKMEETLQESEERFRNLFETTHDMIQSVALDGHFIFVNRAWLETLGYTEVELPSLNLFKIIHPESLSHCQEMFSKVMAGKSIENVQATFVAKDGRPVLVEGNATGRYIGGKLVATQGIFRDITERKQAEENIKRAAEEWKTTFDSITDLVSICDKDYRLIRVNKAFAALPKKKPEELIGKPCYEIVHGTKEPLPNCPHKKTIETKKPATAEFFEPHLGIHLEVMTSPIFNEKDEVTASVHVIRDITERKKAEDEIKRAAEEWRTTFDSITDLVFIIDENFRLLRVNKAFADVLKMKPEELIGKPCYEIVHGTNKPVPLCPHKETIKTKKPATVEFFEPHLRMHLEVYGAPIFDGKGELVGSVHIVKDISERKKMEEQLMVTDRLASIGELASGIAHELNNPLTSIIGFSELLLDKDISDDVKEDLRVINREAQRTAGVVRNLLTFARRHEPAKEPVNINGAIKTVLSLRAYEQKVHNIEVNTRFAPGLPEVAADGFQLQQVFLNIIINAEHFMIEAHRRGTLTITTKQVRDVIRASFADDGPGIAKENLGHLFDPFFTTKEVGKGTGLGLSIAYGIITEHGGRMYAESELGKGATFVVELPISK